MMATVEIDSARGDIAAPQVPDAIPHVHAFNMNYSNITYADMCTVIDSRIRSARSTLIFTPNVDHVVRCSKGDKFAEMYKRADLSVVDGTPLIWALRLLGRPVAEKLSGSDLVPALSAWAAEKGYSVFLLGAAPGVAEDAARVLCEKNPGLKVAGTYSPPLGFENDAEENAKTIGLVKAAKPDLLFVALGSPKQEIWLAEHRDDFGPCASMGIGATFDFIAGRVRRAPRWMQSAGIEWLWRLAQEPRRLWRRYLVEDSAFISLFFQEWSRRNQNNSMEHDA